MVVFPVYDGKNQKDEGDDCLYYFEDMILKHTISFLLSL